MSVVYESGTTTATHSGATYGMGFSNDGDLSPDGFGVARSSTKSVSQTHLARKCSPPEKPREICPLVALLAFAAIVVGGVTQLVVYEKIQIVSLLAYLLAIALVAASVYFYKLDVGARKKHKTAMLAWRSSWICMKCGQISITTDNNKLWPLR